MMRLIQISDTHFGTEVAEVLRALTAAIATLRPDLVLLCGDITQRARTRQFAAARGFMDALPTPAHRFAIPGNHDIPLFNLWARARTPYANYERWFGPRESLWVRDGCCILGLDATAPWRHKNGHLAPAPLRQALAKARAACGPDDLLIVAAHQPLWTAWKKDGEQTLIDREETARLLAEARVDVVLSGHVHVPLIATTAATDLRLPWQFVLSGSGTAVSHRTRAGVPNSFNVIEAVAASRSVTVTQHDFDAGAFRVADRRRLRRGSRGWSEEARPTRQRSETVAS